MYLKSKLFEILLWEKAKYLLDIFIMIPFFKIDDK